jgi:hypothetical protein
MVARSRSAETGVRRGLVAGTATMLVLGTGAVVALSRDGASVRTAGRGISAGPTPSPRPSPSQVHLHVGPTVAAAPAGEPARAAPGVPSPAKPAPPAAAFTAVAGERCPQDATRGYLRAGNRDGRRDGRRGRDGDRRSPLRFTGGWTGDGCSGAYHAVATSDRTGGGTLSLWWFRTGPVDRGSCAVSVYVPQPRDGDDLGARTAHYSVLSGSTRAPDRSGGFSVDQVANQGRWVEAGSFPIRAASVAVQLLDQDGGGKRLAAAQVRVACRR